MRVLCVEDEAPLREDIAEYLRMKSYEVDEAATGEDAISQLNQHQYDLVLCDIKMPRMNGYDLLRQVRQENGYAKTPFLFLTALSERDDRIRANQSGCDGYLTKPIDFSVLDATVRAQIDRQRARDFVNISMLDCTRKHVMATLDDALSGQLAQVLLKLRELRDMPALQSNEGAASSLRAAERLVMQHTEDLQQFYRALQLQTVAPNVMPMPTRWTEIWQEAFRQALQINLQLPVSFELAEAAWQETIVVDHTLMARALAGLLSLMPYAYPLQRIAQVEKAAGQVTLTLADMPGMEHEHGFMLIDAATDLVALSPTTRKRLIALTYAMQVVQTHKGWMEVKLGSEQELAVRMHLPQ